MTSVFLDLAAPNTWILNVPSFTFCSDVATTTNKKRAFKRRFNCIVNLNNSSAYALFAAYGSLKIKLDQSVTSS